MRFHPELGPTPNVGVELEVARWKRGSSMLMVAAALEDKGLMPANVYSQGRHDYHCGCNVCQNIGTRVTFPVLFKLQRDASLPDRGGEFISSPFPLDDVFLDQTIEAYTTIGKAALRPLATTKDQRGRQNAEIGLHVHAFAGGPRLTGMIDRYDLTRFAAKVFYGFAPELFALSAANNDGASRSLRFRQIQETWNDEETVGDGGQDHHMFITNVGTGRHRTVNPHVEWRFWELPYNDEEYVRGAIVVSAALTQILHRKTMMNKLMHIVSLAPWDDDQDDGQANLDVNRVLDRFSKRRFDMLANLILTGTGIADDDSLRGQAEGLINRVR